MARHLGQVDIPIGDLPKGQDNQGKIIGTHLRVWLMPASGWGAQECPTVTLHAPLPELLSSIWPVGSAVISSMEGVPAREIPSSDNHGPGYLKQKHLPSLRPGLHGPKGTCDPNDGVWVGGGPWANIGGAPWHNNWP